MTALAIGWWLTQFAILNASGAAFVGLFSRLLGRWHWDWTYDRPWQMAAAAALVLAALLDGALGDTTGTICGLVLAAGWLFFAYQDSRADTSPASEDAP